MNQEKIGKFIANLRKEKKLTQEQLAEKLGVTSKSISRWENGNTMPDVSLFEPLCKELNIFFKDDTFFNTYGNSQAISYDEFEAIEYILDRHSKDFGENIDIVKLFVNIKQFLTKENQVNIFSTSDIYDIPYEGLSNETNNIRVLTLPNTKNIVNMYPILKK